MYIKCHAYFFLLAALASPECPTPNGRFASGDQCDAYIECQDDVPVPKLCPDGKQPSFTALRSDILLILMLLLSL